MIDAIRREVRRAFAAIRLPFFGVVRLAAGRSLQVQGMDGELMQDIQMIQQFGFASGVPLGAQVVILPLMGSSRHAVAVASAGPAVQQLQAGEVLIYDGHGNSILMDQAGIHVTGPLFINGQPYAQHTHTTPVGESSPPTGAT